MPANRSCRGDPALPAAATLDEAALARLRELDPTGANGVLARVMAAYDGTLARFLGELEAQRADPQTSALTTIAHTLKSSSASVGALVLARLSESIERRLRAGAAAQTHDVEDLIREAQAAQLAVRAMLVR